MNGKTKIYITGQQVGPYGNIFVEEVERNSSNKRKAKFICPFCKKEYIATIATIKSGKQKGCKECGLKRTREARRLDLTYQTFGYLTALYPLPERKHGNVVWHCKCKCGKETDVIATELKNGYIKSCGCYCSEITTKRNTIDITGQKFGKLTAIRSTGVLDEASGCYLWEFKCDCGNIKIAPCSLVTSENTTSCGCAKSRGESKISNILISLNIKYITQYCFKECWNDNHTKRLLFDFYLPDYNICIEYDGEQHFFANGRTWNTEEHRIKTQHRDNIKNAYCLHNDIPLIRIAYTSFKILDETFILNLVKQAQKEGGIIRG